MSTELPKQEYLALPLDFCYFDRTRYDKLKKVLPTEILSFRKLEGGFLRVHFTTREESASEARRPRGPAGESNKMSKSDSGGEKERTHLLWIRLLEFNGKKYVQYRCDCKYFDYRQLRVAKRLFDRQELEGEQVVVVPPQAFDQHRAIFNLDKHAFVALTELLQIQIPVTV
ncbi:MAG: hypothetical protein ACTSYG_11285 [Candidatus Heimdallarchaeota archaeon]|nr:MAG: hypothetical protein DRN32_06300 [Thermococci archaeon]RLI63831.1 MAG: hypothetical protein DRO63_08120 [Candidatus Gerdarchaeota archaeon]RLI69143.1 MAG: hypothetical protein DRP02_11245 [Candidatus Gerdarchaeota archaeon]